MEKFLINGFTNKNNLDIPVNVKVNNNERNK